MSATYSKHPHLQEKVALVLAQLNVQRLVLIHGPSGSGKTHLSQWLHQRSPFAEKPLQIQEAAGLAETRFESQLFGHVKGAFTGAVQNFPGLLGLAHESMLLLESVEDLGLEAQARLLRFLETRAFRPVGGTGDRHFHGAVVMTSRFSPKTLLEKGVFREDFYYRITGAQLAMPPCTERPQDFEAVFAELAQQVAEELGRPVEIFTPADREDCRNRQLPGGFHALRNLLYRAGIMGVATATLSLEMAEEPHTGLPETGALKTDLAVLEKALLIRGLRAHPHSRQALAEHLGISMRTLMYKLRRHGLQGDPS